MREYLLYVDGAWCPGGGRDDAGDEPVDRRDLRRGRRRRRRGCRPGRTSGGRGVAELGGKLGVRARGLLRVGRRRHHGAARRARPRAYRGPGQAARRRGLRRSRRADRVLQDGRRGCETARGLATAFHLGWRQGARRRGSPSASSGSCRPGTGPTPWERRSSLQRSPPATPSSGCRRRRRPPARLCSPRSSREGGLPPGVFNFLPGPGRDRRRRRRRAPGGQCRRLRRLGGHRPARRRTRRRQDADPRARRQRPDGRPRGRRPRARDRGDARSRLSVRRPELHRRRALPRPLARCGPSSSSGSLRRRPNGSGSATPSIPSRRWARSTTSRTRPSSTPMSPTPANAVRRSVCGGSRAAGHPTRLFAEATVLDGVTVEMVIAHDETFGPVVPVIEISSARRGARDHQRLAVRPDGRGLHRGPRARARLRRGGTCGLGQHQRFDQPLGVASALRWALGERQRPGPRRGPLAGRGVHRAEDDSLPGPASWPLGRRAVAAGPRAPEGAELPTAGVWRPQARPARMTA